jgi:tetratricopeptide (TPR) repeat protein
VAGLVSDPARQAHDSFRGYVYQILRSILVWMDLGDGEQLFLEGAEDLDRIGDVEAVTEQVKDTVGSGNITLRTASVIAAINNFWSHRSSNPQAVIRFRYVTTSAIGVEQNTPFGDKQGGLDLWNALRAASAGNEIDSQISLIVDFLISEGHLSDALKHRIAAASPRELLEEIIIPIEWLAGQLDCHALERQIKDRLVVHGATLSIPPADAELAFDALYKAAFDAAKQKDGVPLTKAQFLRIFASATGMHIAKQDFMALVRAAMSPTGGEIAVQARPLLLEGPPPLPEGYFRRLSSELELETSLAAGTVLMHGSTGSGKTLSAASTFAGREPLWLMLRDLNPAQVKARLQMAVELLRAQGVSRILVIDDLDTLSDPRLIEGALGALWHCQNALGGKLVITADRPLPERLAQAVQLDAQRELLMRPFGAKEIEAFLIESGCPGNRASTWSKMLELSTVGHPQLVNARVRALSAKDYPEPEMSDFLGVGDELDRIKFEARRLITELADGPRELLLRASLVTGRVTRDHLIAIGGLEKAISEPGNAFDIIAGPWLETTDDGEYRVSPLARGAAEQLRGQDWTKAMHGQLAWTYLRDRTISPWDISSILMHCYIAGTAGPLVFVSQGIFSADEEVWTAVGKACAFYATLGLDASNPLPFKKQLDIFTFRILQYRIAVEAKPDMAMRIAMKIDEEYAVAPDDDARRMFRFLYLSQFLSVSKIEYPIEVIVARALEFYDVGQAMETSFPDRFARAGVEDQDALPRGSYAQFASLRLFSHLKNIDEFMTLFEALKARTTDDARAILEFGGLPDDVCSGVVERLWLAQHRTQDGQWQQFRTKLRDTFDFSVRVGAINMARGIAPVLLRLINEDIGDTAGAIAEAEQLGPEVGDDPVYLCSLAKVINDAGDYPKAREIWSDALPRWPKTDDDLGIAFAYRIAAIASGRHKDWLNAASYLNAGMLLVDDGYRPTFAIGLAVDAAFARFMAGARAEAVTELAAAVAALEPLQADYTEEPLLSLQRRTGGVLSATAGWTAGERTDDELANLIGLCSNLDPFETDAPIAPPLDTLQLDIVRLELAHGSTLNASLALAFKLRTSAYMSLRVAAGPILFQIAQRTLDFSDTVADGLRQLDSMAMLAEELAKETRNVMCEYDGQPRPWAPGVDEFLIGHMVVAVFAMAAANELDRLPLARWRTDSAAHPEGERVIRLIKHLEGLFVTGAIEPWATVLKCQTGDWSHHASSALAATLLQDLAPDAMLASQALWVHYLKQPHLASLTAHYIAYLVTEQWREVVFMSAGLEPAEKLLAPLAAALDEKAEGWAKVRAVLQAALQVVPLDVDDNARVTIEAMEP